MGTHKVTALAYDSLDLSTTLGTRTITVATSSYYLPFGRVDQAVDSSTHTETVSQSGNVLVTGWAADVQDGAPVGQYVQILIDGNVVGTATLGIARPDVEASYGKPAYLNSGWTFTYSAAGLSPGPHTVSAVAYDAENQSATLQGIRSILISTP
jgi:hypothetical protein